jgi:histidinol-phosphatase (PHP family)
MLIDTRADSHVHTFMCRHAVGTMEEYVKSAISKDLTHITFLEHLEEGIKYFSRTWLTEEDFDVYFKEGARLQAHYKDRITIGLGVEVGYNPDYHDKILARLAQRDWDLVGLSYHFCRIPGLTQHLNLLSRQQKNISIVEQYGSSLLLDHYLDTLIEAVQVIPAQVLCHLDAGLRFQPGLRFKDSHQSKIQQLLEAVKKSGMSLEINTSGYDIRNEPFPRTDVILRAHDMAIPLRAGSDAHQPAEVGRHFEKLVSLPGTAITPHIT